jgi:hypothetical protein
MGLRMAGESLVVEFFARVDRVDLDRAVALYADEAVFLGARGRVEIRAVMERGLAAHSGVRTRHVIGNLRSHVVGGMVLVEYTNVAYTLDGSGEARSVLDQEMLLRPQPGSGLRIVEHRIMGYELP